MAFYAVLTWQFSDFFCIDINFYMAFFTHHFLQVMVTRAIIVLFDEFCISTPIVISPSLDEAYSKMEQDALKHKSIGKQVAPSSNLSTQSSVDGVRSATPRSVRQARVVHRPESDDCEP